MASPGLGMDGEGAEARAVKAEARAAEAEARAKKAEKEARDMKTRYYIKKERCKRFRARVHNGCDILHESDHYPSDGESSDSLSSDEAGAPESDHYPSDGESSDSLSSDEAGAPDPKTKKRKLRLAPLAGFKASDYESERVQTSGEGAAGGGVPVVEEPKQICMKVPGDDDEYNTWTKVLQRVVVSSHCEKASSVVNALVEAERLINLIEAESQTLNELLRCDGILLDDYGLDVVMGESPEHPVPPNVRVRFHSNADPIHEDVLRFRTKMRQLAYSLQEATASYKSIRESMRLKECQLFLFHMKHGSGSK